MGLFAVRLQHIEVKNFRSVASASLPNIGDLNVLIGQNNSGKSNLLSCLSIFFKCMVSEDIVVDGVEFGSELDFHNRDLNKPIDIRVVFALSAGERDGILGDVISEVPEMRNAVEGLDHSSLLSIRVRATRAAGEDRSLIYVPEIAFVRPESLNSPKPGSRIVLELGSEAARELQTRRRTSRRLRARASALQSFVDRIDADDWVRLASRGPDRDATASSYYLRELLTAQPELAREARRLLSQSSSYEDFRASSLSQLSELQSEAELLESSPLTNKLSTIIGEVVRVPSYINKLLRRVAEVGVLHLRERRKDIGAEEAERLLRLKMSRGGPEVLRGIQEIVQSLLSVQVDAFSVGEAERESDRPDRRRPTRLRAELDVDDFLVEANGAGIREALRIILDYEFEHPDLVIIEEPEIHLHPALETSMLRYLKTLSKSCQILMATHSTNFLDTADLGNVYMTSKVHGQTNSKLLSTEEILEEIPKELGLRLSSLFMFERLIFVEGMTDEAILRELAARMGENFASVNAGFIVMGGGRTMPYFASEATITFLLRRQVKCWFVLDRDERDDAEIQQMEARLRGNVELCVLGKREIENYILIPRALSEYIGTRLEREDRQKKAEQPSPGEVAQALEECADELKEMAVYKRLVRKLCRPSFSRLTSRHDPAESADVVLVEEDLHLRIEALQKAREGAAQIAKETKAELDERWADRRLDIVPGEDLLKKLFARYRLSYKKERDGIGLAGSLTKEEVHPDLRRIIQEACAT
jgi:putative ATP-dependent endonuclease of OLD family